MSITILGIESSCDDTSAAIIQNKVLLSNIIAGQDVHKEYGGVVPELASRAHQQNIIPVVEKAIKDSQLQKNDIDAIAFTRGPGLLGSLLVGTSFAKGLSLALDLPLIEVNHLQAHVLSNYIVEKNVEKEYPKLPFLCLLVSGGHTQIVLVRDYLEMEILGQTIDDAAGEAFDKCAKIMNLPYPGGPMVDKLASVGETKFKFSKPRIDNFDYSFSGLKTSFLYFLRDNIKVKPNFIEENKADLCASLQNTIIDILLEKLILASEHYNIREITIAGGVSANSGLRNAILGEGKKRGWNTYIPPLRFSTDNAAMIAITGYYKYKIEEFIPLEVVPSARMKF